VCANSNFELLASFWHIKCIENIRSSRVMRDIRDIRVIRGIKDIRIIMDFRAIRMIGILGSYLGNKGYYKY
jgi:hypothetical protein